MTARREKEPGNFWKTPVWEVTKPVAIAAVLFLSGGIGDRIMIGSKLEAMIPRLEFLEGREKINSRFIDDQKRKKDYDSLRLAERKLFYKEQLEQQRRSDSVMQLDDSKFNKDMLEAISKPITISK